MRLRSPRPLLACAALILAGLSIPAAIAAPTTKPGDPVVEVTSAVRQGVSAPLSTLPGLAPAAPDDEKEKKEKPLRLLPGQGAGSQPSDGAVQSTVGTNIATVAGGLNFDGLGKGFPGFTVQYAPPDTVGAVGATQYVQAVNTSFAVFDKTTGAKVYGPAAIKTLWIGFGGGCETNNDGDPIVQYDKAAGRWIITQFSVSTTPYLQCVAVSQTSDATGAYNLYAFTYGTTQFNDYPKLSVWPDGYYITYNIFNNGSTFAGPKVCALDRAAMLTGAAATQQCFQLSTSYGGLLPADLDGATAPPTGSPNYLLSLGTNTSLYMWKFKVNWATPASTSLTGPTSIPVAAYTQACSGGTCIAQPGTSQKLDSLADRLMYRLAYRNRGGVESLVVNHAVQAGGTNKRNAYAGIRWYELRNLTAAVPTVYQQSTFAPDTTSRWMGSIAMDKVGNIAVGYSASSGSVYPSLRYTGRFANDAVNTMQAENSIIAGTGSQLPNLSRWGDYSALTLDPTDDCTFWYTGEYMNTSGTFNWNTRIASFKLTGCQ